MSLNLLVNRFLYFDSWTSFQTNIGVLFDKSKHRIEKSKKPPLFGLRQGVFGF